MLIYLFPAIMKKLLVGERTVVFSCIRNGRLILKHPMGRLV